MITTNLTGRQKLIIWKKCWCFYHNNVLYSLTCCSDRNNNNNNDDKISILKLQGFRSRS